jgi:hypothetical protein
LDGSSAGVLADDKLTPHFAWQRVGGQTTGRKCQPSAQITATLMPSLTMPVRKICQGARAHRLVAQRQSKPTGTTITKVVQAADADRDAGNQRFPATPAGWRATRPGQNAEQPDISGALVR